MSNCCDSWIIFLLRAIFKSLLFVVIVGKNYFTTNRQKNKIAQQLPPLHHPLWKSNLFHQVLQVISYKLMWRSLTLQTFPTSPTAPTGFQTCRSWYYHGCDRDITMVRALILLRNLMGIFKWYIAYTCAKVQTNKKKILSCPKFMGSFSRAPQHYYIYRAWKTSC